MMRYVLAAAALKTFSLNSGTRKLYRWMGNKVGGRNRVERADLPNYILRGDLFVELCRKYGAVKDGDQLFELGTGWMHWYALYLRLHFNVRIATLDIWDNRQFDGLQGTFKRLQAAFAQRGDPPAVMENLRTLLASTSFEDLYSRLGLTYTIEPTGSIAALPDGSQDCAFSFHVLEHVPAGNVPQLCRDMYRAVKPGGYSIHQIGIDDHLSHYDRGASHKQYLSYSDTAWDLLFENEVQYQNRIQMSEWIKHFEAPGFKVLDVITEMTDISKLRIANKYRSYSTDDLKCTILTLVMKK